MAAVTCEQMGNIALATEQYRNQGESLQAVLAEANKLENDGQFSKDDMLRIRRTVQESFDRTRSALEILAECKQASSK